MVSALFTPLAAAEPILRCEQRRWVANGEPNAVGAVVGVLGGA